MSVLRLFSKIFEKVIYDQLSKYLEKFLNILLCGFRKAHSSQHALFKLLQAWQEELDKSGFVETILMIYLKPMTLYLVIFLSQNLKPIVLINNYLTNCKQITKISSSYSDWSDLVRGIRQGSILGPLLFNLFIYDLFLSIARINICNFADDNTIYNSDINLQTILKDIKYDMQYILKWFKVNSLKLNPKKFKFMILGKSTRQSIVLNIKNIKIRETSSVVLLGFTIENRLLMNLQ